MFENRSTFDVPRINRVENSSTPKESRISHVGRFKEGNTEDLSLMLNLLNYDKYTELSPYFRGILRTFVALIEARPIHSADNRPVSS